MIASELHAELVVLLETTASDVTVTGEYVVLDRADVERLVARLANHERELHSLVARVDALVVSAANGEPCVTVATQPSEGGTDATVL